jgi:hypothetical protein
MLYGKKIAYLLHINIQQLINMLRIELLWGGGGGVFFVTPKKYAKKTEWRPHTIGKSNLAFWECSLPMGFTYHKNLGKGLIMNLKPDVNLKA